MRALAQPGQDENPARSGQGLHGVTIATIVLLTLLATAGGYQACGRWLERWGNVLTSAVLIVIGGLVVTGAI